MYSYLLSPNLLTDTLCSMATYFLDRGGKWNGIKLLLQSTLQKYSQYGGMLHERKKEEYVIRSRLQEGNLSNNNWNLSDDEFGITIMTNWNCDYDEMELSYMLKRKFLFMSPYFIESVVSSSISPSPN